MHKPHHQIDAWIREQQTRLGLLAQNGEQTPTGSISGYPSPVPAVTVYPSPYVIERLAHAGADLLIANNPAYDAMCARLDAELAEILEGSKFNLAPLPRSKHSRKSGTGPRVMTND